MERGDSAQGETHLVASAYAVWNGRVLLIKHRQLGRWLAPGGHLKADERPEQCAARELEEETGVVIRIVSAATPAGDYPDDGVQVLPAPIAVQLEEISPGIRHLDFVYAGVAVAPELTVQAAEIDDVEWFGIHSLPKLALPRNVEHMARWAVDLIQARLAAPDAGSSRPGQ